jgi:hypothetical protein
MTQEPCAADKEKAVPEGTANSGCGALSFPTRSLAAS